jgi:nucleoside-diphosphate-sugar epimerase
MKVLVTGASGFIGSHVCTELRARGVDVRGLCRPGHDRRLLPCDVEWMECDLLAADASALARAAEGVDVAVHGAWTVVPGEYLTSPENEIYRAASARLFSALIRSGCEAITGIGTCFEYEQREMPLGERAATRPLTPYAVAKLETARQGESLAREAGIRFAWARLFYLYGPREDPRRLVPYVALKLLKGERASVTRGRQVRDFLHVGDVASALAWVALGPVSGAINIGSGVPVSVRDVLAQIGEITGRADLIDFGARADNFVDPPYVCADNRRLREQTGWRPRFGLHDGLEQTISWWRSRL